jgi:hypothetical protein
MKKILLLALVVLGTVLPVKATGDVVVYFSPNYGWTQGTDVKYYLNQTNGDESSWKQTLFEKYNNVNNVYYATFSGSEGYTKFKIQKYEGSNYKNQFNEFVAAPSSSIYYIMYNGNYGNEDYYPYYTSTYLPCNYYLASDISGSWKIDEQMQETSSGTFEATISRSLYKGKYLTWAPGYAFLPNGTISAIEEYRMVNGWDYILRPNNNEKDDITIDFQNYSYNNTLVTGDGSVWILPSSEEGDVTVSYTPSTNSAIISCTKSTSIGDAGYITYSNGEMCTISGATAYIVSAKNTNSVTLTAMDVETIWPANEGMILKKTSESSTVTISSVASSATASSIGTNYLVGTGNSTKEFESTDFNDNIYTFSWDGSTPSTVGFYLAAYDNTTPDNNKLAAHKAYLERK